MKKAGTRCDMSASLKHIDAFTLSLRPKVNASC